MTSDDLHSTTRLRIAHVILSRGFAGSERSTVESCNAQCREHEVLLIVRRDHRSRAGASIRDHVDARVRVEEVPARIFTAQRMQALLREFAPDVVHAHLRRSTTLLARMQLAAGKVATLHLGINGRRFLDMDALICISPWQLQTVPPGFGGRAVYIPNSLVPHRRLNEQEIERLRAELGAGQETYLIGGVGRLAQSKGWDVLLRAFNKAALPGARLVLVGAGRERKSLERLAGRNVHFTGFRNDVKDLYQSFDLFVCPSRREPMGRVILEALDAGVPVIASAADGPREIFAEYPGDLVPIGDSDALAEALRRNYEQGRRRVEVDLGKHHLDNVSQELLRVYRAVAPLRRAALRVLFVPVSTAAGAGEYFRCLGIARVLQNRWPDVDIHFVLNRSARYVKECPYRVHLLDDSPTRSVAEVNEILGRVRPTVAVFDSSGRVAQYKVARALGCRLVYVSSRPRTRWKGFRVRRMRLIDQHWFIEPPFAQARLSRWEAWKLRLVGGPQIVRLATIFEDFSAELAERTLAAHDLAPLEYVLVCPGGAGQFAGRMHAPVEFAEAARMLAAQSGLRVVYVGADLDDAVQHAGVTGIRFLPNSELMALLAHARLAVVNGGSLLLQALAQGTPTVSAPIAHDQPARIAGCSALQATRGATLSRESLVREAVALLEHPGELECMRERIAELAIANGAKAALGALEQLLEPAREHQSANS